MAQGRVAGGEAGSGVGGSRPSRLFRTPLPLEHHEIRHPDVPAGLDGLTVLHIADLHIRHRSIRAAQRTEALFRLLERLEEPPDLVAITGDMMSYRGDEPAALRVLERLTRLVRGRLGCFGVFGNHDSHPFRAAASAMGGIRWMDPHGVAVVAPGFEVVGCSWPEDWLAAALAWEPVGGAGARPFRIALCHTPATLPAMASLGLPVALAGHTHGGQARFALPWNWAVHWAPHNSSDVPRRWSSGLLRMGDTLCAVSRGIGTQFLDVRWSCPWQVPLYTVRKGPLVGGGEAIQCVARW